MPDLQVFATSAASGHLLAQVRRLLLAAFDGDFSDDDWEHSLGGWHVVLAERNDVIAHAAVVPRAIEFGGRPFASGYVEAVATAPQRQRTGLGGVVMNELAAILRREFDVGVLSSGRHHFYERLGWERWRGPSFVRQGDRLVRTGDEDDGIMVLRFGPSRELDLGLSITCDARGGDDW